MKSTDERYARRLEQDAAGLREKLRVAEAALRDIADSEEIPTSRGAYEFCRDVAKRALTELG